MPSSSRVLTSTTSTTAFLVILATTILATVSGTSTNLALSSAGGIATQTCDYNNRADLSAIGGIDGIICQGPFGSVCPNLILTCHPPISPYWQVVLPTADSVIEEIIIHNRMTNPGDEYITERIQNTKVQVYNASDALQYEKNLNDGDLYKQTLITVTLPSPVIGNRVRLQKSDDVHLNFREVQVMGYVPTPSPTDMAAPGSFEIHSTGNVTGTAISGTTVAILATYNASNRVHNTTVLSPDCITPFPADVAEAFTVTTTEPMSSGDGFIAYNSTIAVDISKVNTTEYWEDLPGGALGGVFDLCIESAIYFVLPPPDNTQEKMNFVNTNLTLTVEMDANFEVTKINAERKDATQENLNLDYSDYVRAYECVGNDLQTEATNQEYSQGDELKICVKSTDPNIVQVESIKSLSLSQDDAPSNTDFDYITGGSPVSPELAATDCDKKNSPYVCHADMQLLGRYFEDESPGELTATGSVELTFSNGRRLTVDVPIASDIRGGDLSLVEQKSARRMEDSTPDDSLFDVKVSLKYADGSGSDYFGDYSLVSGLVAATGGAIVLMA